MLLIVITNHLQPKLWMELRNLSRLYIQGMPLQHASRIFPGHATFLCNLGRIHDCNETKFQIELQKVAFYRAPGKHKSLFLNKM